MSVITAMDLLSHVQPWNIGHVTKIIISVSSLSAVELDLILVPASQTYNECIFTVSSDVTGGTRNRTQASLECFEVKLEVPVLYELL